MAFSSSSGGGFGGRRFRGTGTLSEINIVPLVDVVLVLLVIFMLTAHVMDFGLEVDVPKVKQTQDTAKELPVVSIRSDGEYYLNDKKVNINQIGTEVRKRFANASEVYLRADKGVIWDAMAQMVSALNEAHLKIDVVTQPVDEADRKR